MRIAGLIVAAGRGARMGARPAKQYRTVAGRSILRRAIEAFADHPDIDLVVPVIQAEDRALHDAALAGWTAAGLAPPVTGAGTRSGSVRAGLEALAAGAPDRVLIHDAARPFVPASVITAVCAALDRHDGAVPALPVVDALWQGTDGLATAPVPRAGLWRAQTPQGFRFAAILAAYRAHHGPAADDVAVARAAGLDVAIVAGDEAGFKITTADDLARARALGGEAMDIRTGSGFDVHAFGAGDAVTLCGVRIPFERGLTGHSDADVGMHALTDAVFGALAEGDIGRWFPPTDPRWRGAASRIFLEKAMERARAAGFAVTHLDCTLICEAPRIGPHAEAMRAALADIASLAPERISVKATTTERLGFPGRGEGIAALATATLMRA